MLIRARAPLRLGLGGGGTDLSPYCNEHGGAILNATIDLYAYATLTPTPDTNTVVFVASDTGDRVELLADAVEIEGALVLHRAVYRRIVKDYWGGVPFPCNLSTYCEAPPGSGLGSSSTLVVAIVKAFVEALRLPLDEYAVARLAFEIERIDAALGGGRQDQYAATFGGFNFMEFGASESVVVNPLRIKNWVLSELEASIVLFHTGQSRASATIIAEQTRNIAEPGSKQVAAMHALKADAYAMKEAVLTGNIKRFAEILNHSWVAKRETALSISNDRIETVMAAARGAGAVAAKVSGAGGGGFITFVVDPVRRVEVMRCLDALDGQVLSCSFTKRGAESWRIE
jgi:D-glycero-alpha-D-manno-heptose-7-phosphate kinase